MIWSSRDIQKLRIVHFHTYILLIKNIENKVFEFKVVKIV